MAAFKRACVEVTNLNFLFTASGHLWDHCDNNLAWGHVELLNVTRAFLHLCVDQSYEDLCQKTRPQKSQQEEALEKGEGSM